jgi:hypothetical protein
MERAVISALLGDSAAIERIRPTVRREHFADRRHATIYRAMLELSARGRAIDPLTVGEELERRGDLADAGGKEYIGFLVDEVPNASHVEEHAAIVREHALKRDLVPYLRRAIEELESGRAGAADLAREIVSTFGSWTPEPSKFRLLSDRDLAELTPPSFLVESLLPAGGLVAAYGPPGCGKSFLALDLACCVATGEPWLGHRIVMPGEAVYVAAEGSAGLARRVAAWRSSRGFDDDARLGVHFCLRATNLLETVDAAALLGEIRRAIDAPALIVFDTLHRSMPGGDENSAKDVGRVIENVDRIRRDTGAAVLLVHHSRKDSDVERGSTSLRGAVDTLLRVSTDEARVLSCEKQKDAAEFKPITFELAPAPPSCVVRTASDAWELSTPTPTRNEMAALTALSEIALGDGSSNTEWKDASRLANGSFERCRKSLIERGYVALRARGQGKRYSLTDSGKQLLTPNSHTTPTQLPLDGLHNSHNSHTPLGVGGVGSGVESEGVE